MTRIADVLRRGPTLSFEYFPPGTPAGLRNLHSTMDNIDTLAPSFVSITYGAGGSSRERTRDLVVESTAKRNYPVMPHLTCMGHSKADIAELLRDYADNGVENILALAGDPPADGSDPGGDFRYASELVELIRESGDFSIAVAAQPEMHPRSPDRAADRQRLAEKLSMADFGITNFFFDVADYSAMRDELSALGCDTPILPGVMPVTNTASIRRFAGINQSKLPEPMWSKLESLEGEALLDAAVDYACELIRDLQDAGAPGIHLYALNQAPASLAICERMGLAQQ